MKAILFAVVCLGCVQLAVSDEGPDPLTDANGKIVVFFDNEYTDLANRVNLLSTTGQGPLGMGELTLGQTVNVFIRATNIGHNVLDIQAITIAGEDCAQLGMTVVCPAGNCFNLPLAPYQSVTFYVSVSPPTTLPQKDILDDSCCLYRCKVSIASTSSFGNPPNVSDPVYQFTATAIAAVTGAPVTGAPATPAPVTDPPVTPSPTKSPTKSPVTPSPVTPAPVTGAPVTPAPVTDAPVTDAPVTDAPTLTPTPAPVTMAPVVATVMMDPVIHGFDGSKFYVTGEHGHFFNLFSSATSFVNAEFVAFPDSYHPEMTWMGTVTVGVGSDVRVVVHRNQTAFVNGEALVPGVRRFKCATVELQRGKDKRVVVSTPDVKVYIFAKSNDVSGGNLFNNLNMGLSNLLSNPHGLVGQTAGGEKAVAQDKDGLGIIEGTIRDYDVGEALSHHFAFDRFHGTCDSNKAGRVLNSGEMPFASLSNY